MAKNTIPLSTCSSSQIHAHGFDPSTGTLALQFKSRGGPGSVYHYRNVTQEMYDAFRTCDSLGRFFGEHFKTNAEKFPFEKQADE